MIAFHYIVSASCYARLLVWPDRPPVAYFPKDRRRINLEQLVRFGAQLASPPLGPLGPRPVVLSAPLVECWLPEDEWRHWKGAAHVQSGQRQLLERIEKEILEYEESPDFDSLLRDMSDLPPFS